MKRLADLAAVIRSGQVSHRDAGQIIDRTPGLREYMADTSALPPMAWNVFTTRYPASVGVAGLADPLPWSTDLSRELAAVNARVNAIPVDTKADLQGLRDTWDIWPPVADCNDYAVTKRHVLLGTGHPASCLLLAEVEIDGGKHHLVLVVRTSRGDIVLNNLTPALLLRADVGYRFIRMQSPDNPNLWE